MPLFSYLLPAQRLTVRGPKRLPTGQPYWANCEKKLSTHAPPQVPCKPRRALPCNLCALELSSHAGEIQTLPLNLTIKNFFKWMNASEWYWLIKLYGSQECNSVIHHLYITLCVHYPKPSLLPSPFNPVPSPTSPRPPFPLVITTLLSLYEITNL